MVYQHPEEHLWTKEIKAYGTNWSDANGRIRKGYYQPLRFTAYYEPTYVMTFYDDGRAELMIDYHPVKVFDTHQQLQSYLQMKAFW